MKLARSERPRRWRARGFAGHAAFRLRSAAAALPRAGVVAALACLPALVGAARTPVQESTVVPLPIVTSADRESRPGTPAPDFELPEVGGAPFVLREARRDAWVLLVFTRGMWCPWCVRQLVELQALDKEFGRAGLGLRVVALVCEDDEGGQGADVRAKSAFRGSVLFDRGGLVRDAFGLEAGSLVLVDPAGSLRWVKPGTRFKRPRAEVVEHAVRAFLARTGDPQAVPTALEGLASESPARRRSALQALAALEAIEEREAIERTALEDPSPDVRVAAIEALAAMRAEFSVRSAARAVAARDLPARAQRAAARALLAFGDDYAPWPSPQFRPDYVHAEPRALRAALPQLLEAVRCLLEQPSEEARELAARLLWRVRSEEAREPLLSLARDKSAAVRAAALAGLCEWRTDARVREIAGDADRDPDAGVRRMARYLLDGPEGKVRE